MGTSAGLCSSQEIYHQHTEHDGPKLVAPIQSVGEIRPRIDCAVAAVTDRCIAEPSEIPTVQGLFQVLTDMGLTDEHFTLGAALLRNLLHSN